MKDVVLAFPAQMKSNDDGKTVTVCYSGMALRDWFAGQALVGATVGRMLVIATTGTDGMTDNQVAEVAGSVADAMMKERES